MTSKFSSIVLCLLIGFTVNLGFAQDSWNGGPGNWSNCADWTPGCPGPGSNALIYSSGNDNVTLDLGTTTINSLTLGGVSNGFTSELTDGGTAQTLNITTFLTVGQTGVLVLSGGSTVTAGADSSNAGSIQLFNGSLLSINGNVDNAGVLGAGYGGGGGDTLNISGTLTNQASGQLILGYVGSGPASLVTLGGLANSGIVGVANGDTLQINGDVTNSGLLATGYQNYFGNNTLTITGNLTNSGTFQLNQPGDSATMQTLNNTGAVGVVTGASLNLTNQPGGITDVVAGSSFSIAGSFTAGLNNAFANLTSIEGAVTLFGQNDTITPSGSLFTIAGSGSLQPYNASSVNINGNVDNAGVLGAGYGGGGGDTLNISGTLTNQASGQLILGYVGSGPASLVTLGGLANSGIVGVANGDTLQINGDVTNSGLLATGYQNYFGNNTLTITGNLTNSGTFQLNQPGDSATMQTLNNTGAVGVVTGASLNLTNQPGGITDVVAGSSFSIAGSFTAGLNNAFANLTSIEGAVTLFGQNDTITPSGSLFTIAGSGSLQPYNASSVNINGNVDNAGVLGAGYGGGGGDTLNISGTLTNQASGQLILGYVGSGPASLVTLGGLANSGIVGVANGDTLQINGDVTNSGLLATGYQNYFGNNTLTITGNLTNSGTFQLNQPGDSATMQTLNNTGDVAVVIDASLNLTNQPGGFTDVVADSSFNIAGRFTAGANNAFANLTSLGLVSSFGQNDTITLNGGTFTLAGSGVSRGHWIYGHHPWHRRQLRTSGCGLGGTSGDTLTISGSLTNQAGGQLLLG